MGGFNKLIGRYTPYGDYPYIIQQNAKIRQMNSLVQRDASNLYKQIADPYGQNPFGEFGTDIQGGELQAQVNTTTSLENAIPKVEEQKKTDEEKQKELTTTEPEVKQPTFKYNRVDIPFCKGYINTPWYNWTFSSTQQTALNMLQARGDDLLIGYFSEENKYPPLASSFLLPNTNPKFTKYNYSDRQMAYLYYNRHPNYFRYICPSYDQYVLLWCKYFDNFIKTCAEHGVNFSEQEIYDLVRPDVMSKPSYERYAIGGNEAMNTDGYLNWQLLREYQNNKSSAIAKVKQVPSQNYGVFIAGTVDTFVVSDGPRPEPLITDRFYNDIQAPSY